MFHAKGLNVEVFSRDEGRTRNCLYVSDVCPDVSRGSVVSRQVVRML